MVSSTRNMKLKTLKDNMAHLTMFPQYFKQCKTMLEDSDREITSIKNNLKILEAHPM